MRRQRRLIGGDQRRTAGIGQQRARAQAVGPVGGLFRDALIQHRRQHRPRGHVHAGAADEVVEPGAVLAALAGQIAGAAVGALVLRRRRPETDGHRHRVGRPGRHRIALLGAQPLHVLAVQPGAQADPAVAGLGPLGLDRRVEQRVFQRRGRLLHGDPAHHHRLRQRAKQPGEHGGKGIWCRVAHLGLDIGSRSGSSAGHEGVSTIL